MFDKVLQFLNDNYHAINLGCTLVVALWAFRKWNISQQQKESELLQELIKEIRTGKVREFVSKCDYGDKWYGDKFHKGADEPWIDHALTVFSNLCYLRKCHFISRKAFGFFEYDLELIFSDSQVVDYLYNLYHDAQKAGLSFPFKQLIDYAFQKHLVKISRSDFEDCRAYERIDMLHNYLGF